MTVKQFGAGVFTIEGFLSPDECAQYIEQSEARGYAEATISTARGAMLYKEARNNDRVVFDDPALAGHLFSRASDLFPDDPRTGWRVCGFNERFRYYRYRPGQQFDWHQDGAVRLGGDIERESRLTFMIYLNDDFEGGNTDFKWESIRPVRGTALVFPHHLNHRGAPVTSDIKYVLRSDVMYTRMDDRKADRERFKLIMGL